MRKKKIVVLSVILAVIILLLCILGTFMLSKTTIIWDTFAGNRAGQAAKEFFPEYDSVSEFDPLFEHRWSVFRFNEYFLRLSFDDLDSYNEFKSSVKKEYGLSDMSELTYESSFSSHKKDDGYMKINDTLIMPVDLRSSSYFDPDYVPLIFMNDSSRKVYFIYFKYAELSSIDGFDCLELWQSYELTEY